MKLCVPEGQKPARWQKRRNNHCCLGFEVAVEIMVVAVVTVEAGLHKLWVQKFWKSCG